MPVRERMVRALVLAAAVLLGFAAQARADLRTGLAAYQRGNYESAIAEFLPLAEEDDADAQYYLGEIHFHGQGVETDFEQAGQWYLRAAKLGHSGAQNAIGAMYMLGLGVKRDMDTAFYWTILSALWSDSEIRNIAFESLGDVARLLTPGEKTMLVRRARKPWGQK